MAGSDRLAFLFEVAVANADHETSLHYDIPRRKLERARSDEVSVSSERSLDDISLLSRSDSASEGSFGPSYASSSSSLAATVGANQPAASHPVVDYIATAVSPNPAPLNAATLSSLETLRQTRSTPFPRRLFDMIEAETACGSKILSWSDDGLVFFVNDETTFVNETLPKYNFRASKLASFQRNLNIYGFQRIVKGPTAGAYLHPLFNRDMNPDHLSRILRRDPNFRCRNSTALGRAEEAARRMERKAQGLLPPLAIAEGEEPPNLPPLSAAVVSIASSAEAVEAANPPSSSLPLPSSSSSPPSPSSWSSPSPPPCGEKVPAVAPASSSLAAPAFAPLSIPSVLETREAECCEVPPMRAMGLADLPDPRLAVDAAAVAPAKRAVLRVPTLPPEPRSVDLDPCRRSEEHRSQPTPIAGAGLRPSPSPSLTPRIPEERLPTSSSSTSSPASATLSPPSSSNTMSSSATSSSSRAETNASLPERRPDPLPPSGGQATDPTAPLQSSDPGAGTDDQADMGVPSTFQLRVAVPGELTASPLATHNCGIRATSGVKRAIDHEPEALEGCAAGHEQNYCTPRTVTAELVDLIPSAGGKAAEVQLCASGPSSGEPRPAKLAKTVMLVS